MTDEIEQAAMKGARLDKPSPPEDMLDASLYLGLYSLYSAYYGGVLTREQAKLVKNRLITTYKGKKRGWELALSAQKAALIFWRDMERRLDAYAREPSKDNADKLWAAASGLREEIKPKEGYDELEERSHGNA